MHVVFNDILRCFGFKRWQLLNKQCVSLWVGGDEIMTYFVRGSDYCDKRGGGLRSILCQNYVTSFVEDFLSGRKFLCLVKHRDKNGEWVYNCTYSSHQF